VQHNVSPIAVPVVTGRTEHDSLAQNLPRKEAAGQDASPWMAHSRTEAGCRAICSKADQYAQGRPRARTHKRPIRTRARLRAARQTAFGSSFQYSRPYLVAERVETIARIRFGHFKNGKGSKRIARELGITRAMVRKLFRSGATEFV
jgi:hypothetical protein